MAQQKYVAYVGTYTHENSIGIHVYDIDMSRGRLTERSVAPISNPSNIVVSHSDSDSHGHIYILSHVPVFQILYNGHPGDAAERSSHKCEHLPLPH